MKNAPLLAVLALVTSGCLYREREAVERVVVEPIEADLLHWDGDPRFWTAENGVLIGESTAENPCDRTTYLVWKGEELRDFELTLQYRVVDGNSGVQFRSEEVAPWDVHGYQADLDAANQWTGCLYEQGGRGVVATRGDRVVDDGREKRVTRAPGEEHGSALVVSDYPGWNDYRIRAVGEHVELSVNGVVTSEFVDRSPAQASSGVLALQLHQGPPMRVEFRNLVLRRLLDAAPFGDVDGDWTEARQWVWKGEAEDGEQVWARRSFQLPVAFGRASLWATCDNAMQIVLNGNEVAVSDRWEQPVRVDVTEELRAGANQLCLWARNGDGPAGLALELEVETPDGALRLLSDASWLVTNEDPGPDWSLVERDPTPGRDGWELATEIAPYGSPPWGILGPGSAPAPSRALDAAEIELPPGFEAELLVSVPRLRQGSWVSLCAAPGDRLFASDQYGGLYCVRLVGERVVVEPVEVELGRAHGLLWAFDALYAVVGQEGGSEGCGLYRLEDTDGDGDLDSKRKQATFEGSGEHGPHAVVLGPDGDSLYLVGGNHTSLPPITRSRVPLLWEEDVLLPRIEDPNGHAVGKRAPGGWVVKTDRDATEFELVAVGFRNAYDLAFDRRGALFTFDSDMEWDIGLPWYRPTRILHVTSGAEFGWRSGSGKWPDTYPDSLPAVVDIGLSSPTGVVMGSDTDFPPGYEDVLFAADWAYGTIYAVDLAREGASYRGEATVFARGEPLPVTDLAVSGGALYFTTGGRRAQSGLYRVRWTGENEEGPAAHAIQATARVPAADADDPATSLARLEELHVDPALSALEDVWPLLAAEDRHVRYAARTKLELTDPLFWRGRALAEGERGASVSALLALVRADESLTSGELLRRLSAWHWEAMTDDERPAALRVVGLGLLRVPGFDADAVDLAERLLTLFPTGHDASDRELARILSRLDPPGTLLALLERLEQAVTQQEAVHYAHAISGVSSGWDDPVRARVLAWYDRKTGEFEGGVSFRQYVDALRDRTILSMGDSFLVEAARVDGESADRYAPEPGEPLAFVRDHTVEDLEPALDRLEQGRDFARGKKLFRQTSCLQCHRIAGEGGGTGPDLTGVAGRYGPRDLLESLLDPSATVSDQYRDEEVWTLDGDVAVGRVVSEDDELVVVREADGRLVEVDAKEIELRRMHPLSRMPEGLLDVLSEEDVLDLMAYVLAGGDAADPAFRVAGP